MPLSMRKALMILSFLSLSAASGSWAFGADAAERLAARAGAASERTQMYSNALNSILGKTVIFSSGLDYYTETVAKNDAILQRMNRDVAAAREQVYAGRKKGLSAAELQELQIAYHQAKTRQLKHLLGSIESGLYDSNEYIIEQWMMGSLITSGKIVEDYVSNLDQILEPLLFGDVAGVLKNLVLQALDSTYKVTFVDYVKANYGATEKIAQYWWKTYFVDPVNKTSDQKFVEGTIGQGLNEVKDQFGKKLGERVKLEMLSTGKKMSKEAIEKSVKSHAGKVIKNLIDTPALLVEVAMKYYLSGEAHLLFEETAPNEIAFIKKIRGLVGDDEKEINRCYFEKEHFLSRYEQKNKKPPEVEETKPAPAKPSVPGKLTTVTTMQAAVPEADPWQEVTVLVKADRQIDEALDALDPEQEAPPAPDDVLAQIDELWEALQKDEVRLAAFLERRRRIARGYDELLDKWQDTAEAKLQDKRGLSREELRTRLETLAEKRAAAWKPVQAAEEQTDVEIARGRKQFAEEIAEVVGMFNSVGAMKRFDNTEYYPHYQAFIAEVRGWPGIGGVYQEPLRTSLETIDWILKRPFKDYEPALDSGKPSVFVLKHGPALISGLDGLQKAEWALIDKYYDEALDQYEAWEELFGRSPRWMYEDIPELGNRRTQQHIAGWIESFNGPRKNAFARIARIRLQSGSAREQIADLNRRTMLTLRRTRSYLRNALAAADARAELLRRLTTAFEKSSKARQAEHMELRKNVAMGMHGALRGLFGGDLEAGQARGIIRALAKEQDEAEQLSLAWRETVEVLSRLSEEVKTISRQGVKAIENSREALAETRDKGLVTANDQLKAEAAKALEFYRKSSVTGVPWDLAKQYEAYAKENYVNGYNGLGAYAPSRAIRIAPDHKDFVAVSYGNAAAALRICDLYEEFQKGAASDDEARAAADKVHREGLAEIRKKLDAIGDRPVTQGEKDALMAEINALDKEVVKVYNSYGNNWKHWNSNEETELVLRIERLKLAAPRADAVQKAANDWLRSRLAKYEKDLQARDFGSGKAFQEFTADYWKIQAAAGDVFKKHAARLDGHHSFQYDQDIRDRLDRIHKLHLKKRP